MLFNIPHSAIGYPLGVPHFNYTRLPGFSHSIQSLGERKQTLKASAGDNQVLLEPHPAKPRGVDRGLNRDDYPLFQDVGAGGVQRRGLVELQADAAPS